MRTQHNSPGFHFIRATAYGLQASPSLAASEASEARPGKSALQKPRRTRAKPQQPRGPPSDTREYRGPTLVFTIRTFCEAHYISAAKFHELAAEGRGPGRMRVDRRVYITAEAAAQWRAKQESETNTAGSSITTTEGGTAISAGTSTPSAPPEKQGPASECGAK